MEPLVFLNSTYKKQEEQDVIDGENKTDCRQKMLFQDYFCYTDDSTAFCVCCDVCACFYVHKEHKCVEPTAILCKLFLDNGDFLLLKAGKAR